jgi:hypothetical protein
MSRLVTRAANIVLRPESEWAAIARERPGAGDVFWCHLVPLSLIPPLAYAGSVLIGREGALQRFADLGAALRFALLSACGGFIASLLSVAAVALAVRAVVPLYAPRPGFGDAFRVAAYAGTPVWLAGIVLLVPLDRFPLLSAAILVAFMHCMFLFYLGLHHVAKVPRGDAAVCTAIVVFAGLILSSVAGYYGSAAGLFPHL